ncbi:WSC domain-containing protein [Mycena floridula]|nr:WSC domain-containing protein [Mycena floridula]
MTRFFSKSLVLLTAGLGAVNAYWLMGAEDFLTTERIDPIVNPGKVSGHVHSVLGGSNFRFQTTTANLRQSSCTSIPIPEDKSNYWFPHLYFQWSNGSFSSLTGGAVIYYLFSDTPGTTTAFPDDFRMLSGDPTLRTYDPSSYAQQAVTFLCLDFNGVTTRHNSLPNKACPSGIRAQINFPSCWNGKDVDSPDHKSHVAFLSGGPDSGSCKDPKFPIVLPRIFIEVYWASNTFDSLRNQAMNSTQPFVYSYGDRTGYGYHADFINGWDKGVLQNAVDKCHCNPYGDPTCCVNQGIFHMNQGQTCRITKSVDEQTTGTLRTLPGNNPVQPEGTRAVMQADPNTPAILGPVYAYTGDSAPATGSAVTPAVNGAAPTEIQTTKTSPSTTSTTSAPTTSSSPGHSSQSSASRVLAASAAAASPTTGSPSAGSGSHATTGGNNAASDKSQKGSKTCGAKSSQKGSSIHKRAFSHQGHHGRSLRRVRHHDLS